MKIVLNIGMAKTGTTAIQNRFAAADLPGLVYFHWPQANHGSLLASVANLRSHPFVARFDPEKITALLDDALAQTRAKAEAKGAQTVLVSAERFWRASRQDLALFKDYFDRLATSYDIIAYMREPRSYMESAFQQKLRVGAAPVDLSRIIPIYRAPITRMRAVFGPDVVQTRLYDPARFPKGDITEDLAAQLGVSLASTPTATPNRSLSAEALALLFYNHVHGPDFPTASPEYRRFLGHLETLQGRRLRFSDGFAQPLLDHVVEDVAWAEETLGMAFPATRCAPDDVLMSSQDDLLALAEEATPMLDALLDRVSDAIQGTTPREITDFARTLYRTDTPAGRKQS